MTKKIKENNEKIWLDRQMNLILDNRRLTLTPLFRKYGRTTYYQLCEKIDKEFVKKFNKKWWQFWIKNLTPKTGRK